MSNTFNEFLDEHGVDDALFAHGFEKLLGDRMTLDGNYSLEELRLVVAFMEEAKEPMRRTVAAMRFAALTVIGTKSVRSLVKKDEVTLLVYGDDNKPPGLDVLAAVLAEVEKCRPIGVMVHVKGAEG